MDLWKFFFAFLFVLILIGAAAWLVRRFGSANVGASTNRGRMPRLAVIDAAAVDSRRRLVLVRRDNVEHLLMIGGPSDIVVEPNIQRGPAAAPAPGSRGMTSDAPAWSDADITARPDPVELDAPPPAPEPPPRATRQFPERATPERATPERRTDPFASFAAEAGSRPEIPARNEPMLRSEPPRNESLRNEPLRAEPLRAEPLRNEPPLRVAEPPRQETLRPEPMLRTEPAIRAEPVAPVAPSAPAPRAPAPDFSAKPPPRPATSPAPAARPAPPAAMSDDQNLAEMAQRLEAALRRPGADPRAAAPSPTPTPAAAAATDRIGAPPVAPDAPAKPVVMPVVMPVAMPAPAPAKTDFKSLEDEMASLLGRSKNPS